MTHNLSNIFKYVALLFFPFVFVFITLQYKKEFVNYSLCTVDPEMAYLYNSLAITNGHLPYFIDHPGIPIEYIGASVISITHFFRENKSVEQDVMLNPDLYIYNITYSIIALLTFVLIIIGYVTTRITNNVFSGLLFQLTPFVSVSYLSLSSRILPEFLSLLVVSIFFLLCLSYSYTELTNKKNKLYVLCFAIITGFCISIKLTLIPFILIPLIVISGIKNKFLFLLELLFSTSFFLIPALNRWVYFRNWVRALFIHSGQYGSGSSNIVDLNIYKNNLVEIIQNNSLIIYLLAFLIIGLIIYQIPKLKIKKIKDVLYYSSLSFVITSIIIILIIAKQYKDYYVTPAYLLVIPAIVFLLLVLKRNYFFQKTILPVSLLILPFIIYSFELKKTNYTKYNLGEARVDASLFVNNKLNNAPIAVVANYYGAPFLGYATFYGMAYSSKEFKEELKLMLLKTFSNTYIYHGWNNRFNYWDNIGYSLPEIVQKYDSLFLYFGDFEMVKNIENEVLGINRKKDCFVKTIYQNKNTGEKIIKLKFKPEFKNSWMITCDAESLDLKTNDFIENGINFKYGATQSADYARSGKFSSCLNAEYEYGIGSVLTDVQKGDRYIISVWKYDNGNTKSVLVVSTKNGQKYYNSSPQLLLKDGKWQKLQIEVKINDELDGENLNIYCWFAKDTILAYFDDFCVEKVE